MDDPPPLETLVTEDKFLALSETGSVQIPNFLLPSQLHNDGNYVISLNQLVRWLGAKAEEVRACEKKLLDHLDVLEAGMREKFESMASDPECTVGVVLDALKVTHRSSNTVLFQQLLLVLTDTAPLSRSARSPSRPRSPLCSFRTLFCFLSGHRH